MARDRVCAWARGQCAQVGAFGDGVVVTEGAFDDSLWGEVRVSVRLRVGLRAKVSVRVGVRARARVWVRVKVSAWEGKGWGAWVVCTGWRIQRWRHRD